MQLTRRFTAILSFAVVVGLGLSQAWGRDRNTSSNADSPTYGAPASSPQGSLSSGPSPQYQPASLQGSQGLGFYALAPETQGDLMMIHQRFLSAIDYYRRAPQDSAVILNKLGIAYQHMYALDSARMQYEKAVHLDPSYADAINNLGTVYYGQKDYHKAEKYYRKALVLQPGCASFYSNLGTAYFADQKYKQGVAAYQRAFALDPDIFIRESMERIAEMASPAEQVALEYALAKLYARAGNLNVALNYLRGAFINGFDDRKKLMADKDFEQLRATQQFRLLMTEEHMSPAPDAEALASPPLANAR
jgi:tetratricopeptide (TPR) repeat protein